MKRPDVEETTRIPLERRDLTDVQYEDPLAFFRGIFWSFAIMALFVGGGLLLAKILGG